MRPHRDKSEMDRLMPYVREYQALAVKHGIRDIFQDNGGKLLQIALTTGLKLFGTREGNDAFDKNGNEYELKSLNVLLTRSFSTHHHMNPVIIKKYRSIRWVFAVYEAIELKRIYLLSSTDMEPFFSKWEKKWKDDGGKDINNPKIPLSYVETHGKLVYESPDA